MSVSPSASSRRDVRRQERRAAIVVVATRFFFEHGYAGASMSAIAAELGGSKGTLWDYFPSKADLFAAVLDERTTAYRAEIATVLDPQGDLETTILEFCRSFIQKITSPEAVKLHQLVASESSRFPEISEIFQERGPRTTYRLLGNFLSGRIAEGRLRKTDADAAARTLTFLCSGPVFQTLWGSEAPDAKQLEAEARFATQTFLRAFAPDS